MGVRERTGMRAAGHETGTLVNALIAHCGASLIGIGGEARRGGDRDAPAAGRDA